MQRIYVDFGKGIDDQVDIAYASEGERVILYDSSLEVQAVAHADCSDGRAFWYAVPDWSTQKNYDTDLAQPT
jgi:hypothetical protein